MLELDRVDRRVVGVAKVGVRVPEDRARDVALLVRGRADVHFDEPDRRIVEVVRDPVGLHEGLGECVVPVHRFDRLLSGPGFRPA